MSEKMNKVDFKKTQKELYQPKTEPSIIDVPEMTFIMIDGKGDPNESKQYVAAVETLYGLSYTIKMSNKMNMEYVVPPLEGLWLVDDSSYRGNGAAITDKSKFIWTMMIRQPDFVNQDIFDSAKASLIKKKPNLDLLKARLEKFNEGLCVQVMHIGAYDDEPKTILKMESFIKEAGLQNDMSEVRHHHEIYISDPRRISPDKLKTVIRHPVVKEKIPMDKPRAYKMTFASIYPMYIQKAEKKGRTKDEVDTIIYWFTGYDEQSLRQQIDAKVNMEEFYNQAPLMNPDASLIKGVICGYRVEDIEDKTMQNIRYLDKLIDELAKGKAMDKILRMNHHKN